MPTKKSTTAPNILPFTPAALERLRRGLGKSAAGSETIRRLLATIEERDDKLAQVQAAVKEFRFCTGEMSTALDKVLEGF